MDKADLHIHSTISDGLLSPWEIVGWAAKKQLKAISITDHDSIGGLYDAISCGIKQGIEVIPGIELSTEYEGVEVHILGYFIDYKNNTLNSFLKMLVESRVDRAHKMIKKLNSLGVKIDFDDICTNTQDASSIGRPHIARAMVKAGYATSVEDAFNKYLSFGRPAFVERYKVSPYEATELITACRGLSSIAHPGLIINVDKPKLIKKLMDWGLSCIEVYHSRHTAEDVYTFETLADEYGLIPTGGTDCHGELINGCPSIGDVTVPYKSVQLMKEAKNNTDNI